MRLVLLLTDLYGKIGGIQSFNRSFVEAAVALGEEHGLQLVVHALMDTPGGRGAALPSRVRYRGFGGDRVAFSARSAVEGLTADLVFCGHLNLVPVAALSPAPVRWLIVHGIEAWKRLPLAQRFGASRMTRILSVSAFTRDELRRWNPELGAIESAIFPDTLPPAPASDSPAAPSSMDAKATDRGGRILTVSRLSKPDVDYKGIDVLVRAMPQVLRTRPDAVLTVVGEGDGRPALERLAEERGVRSSVRFTGRVDDATLAAHYAACDVFALPSTGEGFGIVFLEAMREGKPCIGARATAVPEVIAHEETGYLVPPADAASLGARLSELLAEPDRARELGLAGRRRLERLFSPEAFRDRLARELGFAGSRAPQDVRVGSDGA